MRADDEVIGEALKERPLTPRVEEAVEGVARFVSGREFAERVRSRLAVENHDL